MNATKWTWMLVIVGAMVAGCENSASKKSADTKAKDKQAAKKPCCAAKAPQKSPAITKTPQKSADPNALKGKVKLAFELPVPVPGPTPILPKGEPNMEKPKPKGYRRPAFYAPKGTAKLTNPETKVTGKETLPEFGDYEQVVDDKKKFQDGDCLDLGVDTQWVQLDLGEASNLHAILIWRRYDNTYTCRDVIVQVSNDKDFLEGVTTLFNNDHDNSSLQGKGKDKQYIETYRGKLIDAKGTKARYVRLYSKGSHISDSNYYTEVEVWGKPIAKTK